MSANRFAKQWDHRLQIKDILLDADPLPPTAETIRRGAAVATRVKALMGRLQEDSDPLWQDLDDVLDEFDLREVENRYEARDRFNGALASLYDIGDYGKRVWIE